MISRRTALAGGVAVATVASCRGARAASTPGVTATSVKIGNTMPYSGPASAFGVIGLGEAAFFKMINDQGGINGRRITFISVDDGYSPPKTVEQVRRLVEQDEVAFIFSSLGTACNSAIRSYLNGRKIPHLFVFSGADKWGDYQRFPWTIGWLPSLRTEAQIYAKYILAHKPDSRIAMLWQNDDFGKDYVLGVKDVLGGRFNQMVIRSVSYEPADPTIDSQAASLQASGADVVITAASPKFAAQMIRRVYDLGWKPLHFLSRPAISVAAVMRPAGPEKGVGIVTATPTKDPTDPAWNDDTGMKEWRAFMQKYLPEADLSDVNYVNAYGFSLTLMQVLKQCGDDLSRPNIMRQSANLHDLEIPILLPGIRINTSPTNYRPIRLMQLARWNGNTWERFGELIEDSGA